MTEDVSSGRGHHLRVLRLVPPRPSRQVDAEHSPRARRFPSERRPTCPRLPAGIDPAPRVSVEREPGGVGGRPDVEKRSEVTPEIFVRNCGPRSKAARIPSTSPWRRSCRPRHRRYRKGRPGRKEAADDDFYNNWPMQRMAVRDSAASASHLRRFLFGGLRGRHPHWLATPQPPQHCDRGCTRRRDPHGQTPSMTLRATCCPVRPSLAIAGPRSVIAAR